VTGWPGISVPAGLTATGLPIGAQLLAHHGQEGLLLALANQLESSAQTGGSGLSASRRAYR
jgi:amidase